MLMSKLIEPLCDMLEKGESVIMATVVRTPGQALLAGAKMLVRADGSFLGTIGGGLLEKEALTIAAEMFAPGACRMRIMEFSGEVVTDIQTLCGKGVTVFIVNIAAVSANLRTYRKLLDALQRGVKCCLITDVSANGAKRRGAKRGVICEDGSTLGEVSCEDERLSALLQKARSVTAPTLQRFGDQLFFIDPWVVPDTVYLFGAGHVAREVAALTAKAGFRTIVLDDREKFADPARFTMAQNVIVLGSFEDCFRGLAINDRSYVIIITRERRHEKTVLRQALATKAGYIGIIGSIRKRDALFKDLMETGFSIDDLLRIYCPVGIGIMAETPVEIAMSIASELILVRAQRKAAQKKQARQLAFHEADMVSDDLEAKRAGTSGGRGLPLKTR
jgi:xanthine dehydrogenase accessory factor